jgi:hypothetical protein
VVQTDPDGHLITLEASWTRLYATTAHGLFDQGGVCVQLVANAELLTRGAVGQVYLPVSMKLDLMMTRAHNGRVVPSQPDRRVHST